MRHNNKPGTTTTQSKIIAREWRSILNAGTEKECTQVPSAIRYIWHRSFYERFGWVLLVTTKVTLLGREILLGALLVAPFHPQLPFLCPPPPTDNQP